MIEGHPQHFQVFIYNSGTSEVRYTAERVSLDTIMQCTAWPLVSTAALSNCNLAPGSNLDGECTRLLPPQNAGIPRGWVACGGSSGLTPSAWITFLAIPSPAFPIQLLAEAAGQKLCGTAEGQLGTQAGSATQAGYQTRSFEAFVLAIVDPGLRATRTPGPGPPATKHESSDLARQRWDSGRCLFQR